MSGFNELFVTIANSVHKPITIFCIFLVLVAVFYTILYLCGYEGIIYGRIAGILSICVTFYLVKYGKILKPTKQIAMCDADKACTY